MFMKDEDLREKEDENIKNNASFSDVKDSNTDNVSSDSSPNFFVIKNSSAIKRIDPRKVCYVTVEDECSTFYFHDGSHFSCSKALSEIQTLLPSSFVRIYRNCLVNISNIYEYRIKQRKIILLNGEELDVSCRNVSTLTTRLCGKS